MSTVHGVVAVAECGVTGEPTNESLETIGAAVALADGLGGEITAVVVAPPGSAAGRDLAGRGLRSVVEVRSRAEARAVDVLLHAAWSVIESSGPDAVLFPDSLTGREVAARVAARLDGELVSGCTEISVRDGEVLLGRPCVGGRALAQLAWSGADPLVVTVAPGVFTPPAASEGGGVEVRMVEPGAMAGNGGVTLVREVAPTPEALDVTEADVVVAGGAGVGGPEGFAQLAELARLLGGTIGASRVAVDRGWASYARQVGQTGKTVSPRLYLALGISGAPQHLAGIRSAGRVVAVNRDPRAPIFRVADLAVVADLREVVPALLERLGGEGVPRGGR